MNLTQEKTLFHLTGKLSLGKTESKALQAVADESPYFAPARFLLTAGLKQTHVYEQWMPHARKTNLYFTNPNWLQYQLEEIDAETQQSTEVIDVVEETNSMPLVDNTEDIIDEEEEYTPPADTNLENDPDNKISGILSSQLADFKKPLEPGAALDIDSDKKPLHTVDYFVSQGIKVDLSAMPQDKLTTHLRKFTDWLKQVKTTQQTGHPQDLGTNLEMEKAVAETARHSNETREIVTESMADVLIKQGQVEKAIQLYIKLSFLNPEKSSYFAAKIEQLKGI